MNRRLLALGMLIAAGLGGACGEDSKSKSDAGATGDGGPVVGQPEAGVPPVMLTDGGFGVVGSDGSVVPVPPPPATDGSVPVVPGGDGGVPVVPPGNFPSMARLSAAGGKLASADKRVTVSIPAGILNRQALVEVKPAATAPAGAIAGSVYEISPGQETVRQASGNPDEWQANRFRPMEVTFTFAGLNIPQPADVVIARWNGTDWERLPAKYNPKTSSTTANLPRLGIVGLITGVCEACAACDANTCPAPGVCEPFGMGCQRCKYAGDGDGDGFPLQGGAQNDCNGDNDPTVYPGATEICNEKDDNCDGHIDEGCKACATNAECGSFEACVAGVCTVCNAGCSTGCELTTGVTGVCFPFGKNNACNVCRPTCDKDGDGLCPEGTITPGQQATDFDCDDTKPGIRTGVPEICGNGIDDNCDRSIDNGCQPCASDAECSRPGLSCVAGVCEACPAACDPATCAGKCQTFGKDASCSRCISNCNDDDGDGQCSSEGDCAPRDPAINRTAPELCGNGIDDNCNDFVDEDCTACTNHAQCPAGQECVQGRCNVCANRGGGECFNPQGDANAVPPIPPRPGVWVARGPNCQVCAPACDKDGDTFCPPLKEGEIAIPGLDPRFYTDCDDTDANANPEAIELCGNDKDDDCDLKAEEECNSCATSMMCGAAEACTTKK